MALIFTAAASFHWGPTHYSAGDTIDASGWSQKTVQQFQAANPVYIASGGGGGTAVDATTTVKGLVKLAGDLAGTAASPTVPTKVSKTGDTMSGDLAMGGHRVTGLADPSLPQDAATKAHVAAVIAALVNGAPGLLDTLGEIAAQLASDESGAAALATTVAGKLAIASNLADLANAATARTNLGLGTAATQPTSAFDAAGAAAAVLASSLQKASNLSDLASASTARTNLGLGTASTQPSSAFAPANATISSQTGASYTFVLADGQTTVEGNSATAQTFTIPPQSSVAWPAGSAITVVQYGAGQITIAAGAGVTLRAPNGALSAKQYSVLWLYRHASDEWILGGDTSA